VRSSHLRGADIGQWGQVRGWVGHLPRPRTCADDVPRDRLPPARARATEPCDVKVACVIVRHASQDATGPAVPSAVPYGEVRGGNEPCEAPEQCTRGRKIGTEAVRPTCICQRHGGKGLGWVVRSAHANTRQVVVTPSKPKALIGLDQNGTQRAQGRALPLSWTAALPATRVDLPYSVTQAEHGKPVALP